MKVFESFAALAMETEGLVVNAAVEFKFQVKTSKQDPTQTKDQTYVVDLVGVSSNKLVLALVRPSLASPGARAVQVAGVNWHGGNRPFRLLNDNQVRRGVVQAACEKYGMTIKQVELRLYVATFNSVPQEVEIRQWCDRRSHMAWPIKVFSIDQTVDLVGQQVRAGVSMPHTAESIESVFQEADYYGSKKRKYMAAQRAKDELPLLDTMEKLHEASNELLDELSKRVEKYIAEEEE